MSGLIVVIVSAVVGALASVAARHLYEYLQKEDARIKLCAESPLIGKSQRIAIRIVNNSHMPLKNCWAYVTIDHDKSDIRTANGPSEIGQLNERSFHIAHHSHEKVTEELTSWSVNTSSKLSGNSPGAVDICPGESKWLEIGHLLRGGGLAIQSETGWHPGRVLLDHEKNYTGRIKFVSDSIKAKTFEFEIACSLVGNNFGLHLK